MSQGDHLPRHATERATRLSRRDALKLLGASAALAAGWPLGGCNRKPPRQIVSRAEVREYAKPGTVHHYSSTWLDGPLPYGLMVKAVDGRPIKVDGNPDHPINQGGSTAAMQAAVLSLYDPDRLRGPMRLGKPVAWADADAEIIAALEKARRVVVITSADVTGPATRALLDEFIAAVPGGRRFVYETVHDQPRRRAWAEAYGSSAVTPRFDRARTIVSFDCDFLGTDGDALGNIRRFLAGRGPENGAGMSRLYAFESMLTATGVRADHRIRMRPSAMAGFVRELTDLGAKAARDLPAGAGVLAALATDLFADPARRPAVVVAGGHLPCEVHAAVARLNGLLDATAMLEVGQFDPPRVDDPREIEAALSGGVDVLILLGVNPAYDWPGGEDFRALIGRVGLSVAHGLHAEETLAGCTFALPSHHVLESWGDAAAWPGFASLCQPVIAPLFDTRQPEESLLTWRRALVGPGPVDWHDYLKSHWTRHVLTIPPGPASRPDLPPSTTQPATQPVRLPPTPADLAWEEALRAGGVAVAARAQKPTTRPAPASQPDSATRPQEPDAFEVVILPHFAIYDGRFANNGWLQELPDPISRAVWGNFATISPATARALDVREGEFVRVTVGDRSVELPALIQPGTADGVVVLTLGHGRTAGGVIATEAGGVNVAPLLGCEDPDAPRVAFRATVAKLPGRPAQPPVRTQHEFSQHSRAIAIAGSLAEYRRDPAFARHRQHLPESADTFPPYDYSKGHRWAMTVDLSACVGCGACATACQAENNIPIVGRAECARGRHMHWLRIDRYADGDADNPTSIFQPMLCQHCETAPCETVCPVNATAHSPEGINEMSYNRCVGTRYCQNNCPYKVRRFNFLRYPKFALRDPAEELRANPQVTVRSVGVMEKCTFCIQRINAAKFAACNAGREIVDGDIRTACQQACPAGAIVFGDANDPASRVARLVAQPRGYRVLAELNTKSRITYLARIDNPREGGA